MTSILFQLPQNQIQSNHHSLNHSESQTLKIKKKYKSRKPKFLRKRKLSKTKFNSSLWTIDENKAYMKFLSENIALFELGKIQKRDIKINVQMSKAVMTRSADQCRSHHQKMCKYHLDVPNIIAHISRLLGEKYQQNRGLSFWAESEKQVEMKNIMMEQQYNRESSFCENMMVLGLDYF